MLLLSFATQTMNPVRTKWLGLAALGLSLLTLLAVGILSYNDWREFRKSSDTIAAIRRVVQLNDDLLGHAQDAETGQHGFLLTGRDQYLAPYESAVRVVEAELDQLGALTRGQPETAARVAALRALAARKFEELRSTVELRKSKGLAAALEVVQTDYGLFVMDHLRDVSAEIEADQEDKRRQSWDELERQARLNRLLTLAGAILLAGFVSVGALL